MYERAGQYERAASIYIQTKNFNAAAPLMARISSSKLQLQFAKAKEAEGRCAARRRAALRCMHTHAAYPPPALEGVVRGEASRRLACMHAALSATWGSRVCIMMVVM